MIRDKGIDAYSYAQKLKRMGELDLSNESLLLLEIFDSETTVDIFLPLLNYFISRFTTSEFWLFGIFAAIMGLLYLKNLKLIFVKYIERDNVNTLFFFLFFVVIIPITRINGFRFWTAAWLYFFCAYYVVVEKNPKYFFYSLFAILIHWSFLPACFVLALYRLLGNRNTIYYSMLIASFFLPDLIQNIAVKYDIFYFSEGIQKRALQYASDEYNERIRSSFQEAKWYVRYSSFSVRIYLILTVLLIRIFIYKRRINDHTLENIFSFLIVFLSLINFGINVESISRFYSLFYLFCILFVIIYFSKYMSKQLSIITILGIFPFALYTAIVLHFAVETINIFILGPMPFIFLEEKVAIRDVFFK